MQNSTPHLRLKPGIRVRTNLTPKGMHFVAEDIVQNKYWKMGAIEYEMCAILDGSRNLLDSVTFARKYSRLLSNHPHSRIHQALVWLVQSGVVESIATAAEATNAKEEQRPANPTSKPIKLFDPSSFRMPIIDGQRLDAITSKWTWLLSLPVVLVAACLWGAAAFCLFAFPEAIFKATSGMFVAGQQWWFLIAWLILKLVHEAGHAIACVRVGARTTAAGVGLLFFAPTPFVNVSNVWSLPNRWSRILVSGAGMLFEITLAALAIVVLCCVDIIAIQQLCAAIITLGTISTLMFNGNPLMRFDGYYIFIDLINRPNLWQDGKGAVKAILLKLFYLDGTPLSQSMFVATYGVASLLWRMLTLLTLAWGLWAAWDGIGLMIAIGFGLLWFVLPSMLSGKKKNWFLSIKELYDAWRFNKTLVMRGGIFALLIIAIGMLPSPLQIYWPGHIDYVEPLELRNNASGIVVAVSKHDGQWVQEGDEILRLENPELDLQLRMAVQQVDFHRQRCQTLRAQRKESELQAEQATLQASEFLLGSIQKKIDGLNIVSTKDGLLLFRGSTNLVGSYLQEGSAIGLVVTPDELEVNAILPQDAWENVADWAGRDGLIYLSTGELRKGTLVQVLPRSTDVLTNPSLGGNFGGPLAVMPRTGEDGGSEFRTLKPRLQARLSLDEQATIFGGWRPIVDLPPPGLHCSVRVAGMRESIWGTSYRWFCAALATRLDSGKSEGT